MRRRQRDTARIASPEGGLIVGAGVLDAESAATAGECDSETGGGGFWNWDSSIKGAAGAFPGACKSLQIEGEWPQE
jgi:hypothetical protein